MSKLDETQLFNFETVVTEWIDRQQGDELKAQAVTWFSGMLNRLRKHIGTNEQAINQAEELDRIGLAIVSDCVVTIDGHSSIGFERVAPRISRFNFEGQENIRIVGTDELKPAKCNLKANTNVGEIACRELVFRDAATGREEVRRYALIDGNARRINQGKVQPQWITPEERGALWLIRQILSEVSK